MHSVPVRRLALLVTFSTLMLRLPLSESKAPVAKPNCRETCGNVTIPYPFGMGESRCFLNPFYEITCNNNNNNNNGSVPRPFLRKFNLEVLKVGLDSTMNMIVNNPVYSTCRDGSSWNSTDFKDSPFTFSPFYNSFYNVGCENSQIKTRDDEVAASCTTTFGHLDSSNSVACYGINCCQTPLNGLNLDFYKHTCKVDNASTCAYVFLAADRMLPEILRSKFASNTYVMENMDRVPVYVDWGILRSDNLELINNGTAVTDTSYQCSDQYIVTSWSQSHRQQQFTCRCSYPYDGNAYIVNGCQVVKECAKCVNTCERMYRCPRNWRNVIIMSGTMGGGALTLILVITCVGLVKIFKRRRMLKLQKKFYKKNGGLLLQQKLSANEGNSLDSTKIFSVRELEKATDRFNINRVVGQGGQGTVYKGMLSNGTMVAIKKSKLVDEGQVEQFINEVVILSQINHRNIVKLLGCCLETEVPLLVYEFISNGTLSQLIHNNNQDDEFPLSWEMRLRIATEVSGALAYLHAATSVPIYHRDIKSSNILLDDKYRSKVADFGTSRSVDIDKSHLTTVVQGTFGYLDPEFLRSSQFTDKSDVYSFGVVLAELLTGERPIMGVRADQLDHQENSMVALFIASLEENSLFEIVDRRVAREGDKDDITALAILTSKCLYMNGKLRPSMKEVMLEIEKIRARHFWPLNICNDHQSISWSNNVHDDDDDDGCLSLNSFADYTESCT